MKLPLASRLMGLLALAMQKLFLRSLLAASSFTVEDKENAHSPIKFLVLLKRKTGTIEAFLQELKRILTYCRFNDLLIIVNKFHQDNPCLLSESSIHSSIQDNIQGGFKPSQRQSDHFRQAMIEMSESLSKQHLEIMVEISPIPESSKEHISAGHELFEKMVIHGCISENDTELVQEILELLQLAKPLALLHEYQESFSTTVAHLYQEKGKRMLGSRKRGRDEVVENKMPNPHPQKQYIWLALFTVAAAFLVLFV